MKLKAINKNYFRKDEKRDEKRGPESIIFRKKGCPPAKKSGVIANGGGVFINGGCPPSVEGHRGLMEDMFLSSGGSLFFVGGCPRMTEGPPETLGDTREQKYQVILLQRGHRKFQ